MQRHLINSWGPILAAVAILAAGAATGTAQNLFDTVEIHGFGGWAYAETDGHTYLIGDGDGRYDNADFALNISATPMDNLTIMAQIRYEAVGGEDESELDYAFAGYRFADELNLRIGRVKHPLGLYGEIYDVGTLRPFYTLPQSIYGANGFTARAYNGLGINGTFLFDSGWGLQYDLYGGQIEGDFTIPGLLTTQEEFFLVPEINIGFEVNQTIGARLMVMAPIPGLTFGVSAFTGDDETELRRLDPNESRDVVVGSVGYVAGPWSIRAEYGSIERGRDFEGDGGYLEGAYKLTENWQLAARWDVIEVGLGSEDLSQYPPFFEQLLDHEELSFGVNYWFGPNLVIKASYHQIEGNRHAFLGTEEEVGMLLITGDLEYETDMLVLGAQFSF